MVTDMQGGRPIKPCSPKIAHFVQLETSSFSSLVRLSKVSRDLNTLANRRIYDVVALHPKSNLERYDELVARSSHLIQKYTRRLNIFSGCDNLSLIARLIKGAQALTFVEYGNQ